AEADATLAEARAARRISNLALGGEASFAAGALGGQTESLSRGLQLPQHTPRVDGLRRVPPLRSSDRQRRDGSRLQDRLHSALQGVGNDVEAGGWPDDPGPPSSPIERRVEDRLQELPSNSALGK